MISLFLRVLKKGVNLLPDIYTYLLTSTLKNIILFYLLYYYNKYLLIILVYTCLYLFILDYTCWLLYLNKNTPLSSSCLGFSNGYELRGSMGARQSHNNNNNNSNGLVMNGSNHLTRSTRNRLKEPLTVSCTHRNFFMKLKLGLYLATHLKLEKKIS